MASPQFAIAKASFAATLLRKDPDLPSCTRNDVDAFNSLFQDVVRQCSPKNVQKCKRWILKDVVPSPARSAALGKYLVAAANSFGDDKGGGKQGDAGGPSVKRKKLHVLYLLHDVLYHTLQRHPRSSGFAKAVQDHLEPLFSSVAAFPNVPKHTARVMDLLKFWEEKHLFDIDLISKFRRVVEAAAESGKPSDDDTLQMAASASGKPAKDVPFTLPHMHGDSSMAWFDLPAANWLPHLVPNSTKPMKPDMVKPLQFAQGPADKAMVEAVKTLLAKVDGLFSKGGEWGPHDDLDEMGERVILDEVTGEVVGGETYYGWSRAFCEKMRERRTNPQGRRDQSRGRASRSRSSSRSSYRSDSSVSIQLHHKRRRLSRSYSRSRSRSRSRTRSPRRPADTSRGRDNRSRSPERYRPSGSPHRRRARSRSRTPSPSRHRTDRRHRPSPPPPRTDAPSAQAPYYPGVAPVPPHGQQVPPQHQHQHAPMPPNLPIPPPPYGYTGQWPPPPPPPPPFAPGGFSQGGWNGGAPPLPGMPWGGQAQPYGQGRGGGGYRGDFGRGGGREW